MLYPPVVGTLRYHPVYTKPDTLFSRSLKLDELLSKQPGTLPFDNISRDSLFDGELICHQYQKGYRFSIDPVLLAHFVTVKKGDSVLDLGSGSGIIPMILLYRHKELIRRVVGIEVQQELADLATTNVTANSFAGLARIIHGDIKKIDTLITAESYDTVVCNPPFYAMASGRVSQNQQNMLARHQVSGTLEDFLCAAAFAVKNGGEVYFIYPAERIGECISQAEKYRLETKTLQFIYSYPQARDAARLVLIRWCKNGGRGTEVLPPLYIYAQKNGDYSREIQKYYQANSEEVSSC